jgi:GrpB-like predicted nucleotidyltransferase (UPF0157 family)
MLTPEQEIWIEHLSDTDQVTILPYDPAAPQIFAVVQQKIRTVLGPETQVEHRGATRLEISGQDEIDVYVPVAESHFDARLETLAAAFGRPRSHYPRERARFVLIEAGKHVDIFLINAASQSWQNGIKFENFLRAHPDILDQYRLLKEAGHGLSTREYYRRKVPFFNQIVAIANEEAEREAE